MTRFLRTLRANRRAARLGWITALSIGLVLNGCPEASAPENSVIARIDGEPIMQAEVEHRAAWRLYRTRIDAHRILVHELDALINERLVERAARERGVSAEQLLREIEADGPPVLEAEIDRYLAEHPADVPEETARIRVRHYLEETRRLERRLAFVESRRQEVEIDRLISPPERPCVALDLDGAPSRGPKSARVTVVFFTDASTAESARVARTLGALEDAHPRDLRVLVRSLPRERDDLALRTAQLLAAARAEGVFWSLYDGLARTHGVRRDADLDELARASGHADLLEKVDRDGSTLAVVRSDIGHARDAGVDRAPTLFVNGRFFMGLESEAALRRIVAEELARSTASCPPE